MPQMVLLFLVFFGTTRAWGWDLGRDSVHHRFCAVGTAEMSDLVRGALISIPKHQYESSEALGLTKAQTYWYIIIPQTVRRLIPLSINLITRMIKTTSLVLMIGVVEVLKVAQRSLRSTMVQPERCVWHLPGGVPAVFPGPLAHQPAGLEKNGGKEPWQKFLTVEHRSRAMGKIPCWMMSAFPSAPARSSWW